MAPGLETAPQDGRLFVALNPKVKPEPRETIGRTGLDAPPVLARDVRAFAPGKAAALDQGCIAFPVARLARVQPGDYYVQALFAVNRDLKSLDAEGNLYSAVRKVHVDPANGGTIKIELTQKVPPEKPPRETEYVRYLKIRSALLSKFYGRPIYLRAGVILPRGYAEEPARQYPLRVRIGGFGTRCTAVSSLMGPNAGFRKTWLADGTPRFLLLHLDGDGPFGDPYQVNSANSGPYGDAITRELIPCVERTFRGIGKPYARVLDGGSTGGWVSFALQVFYPDFFNGTWSYPPDPVDFRAYQLVNIYQDRNAYVNRNGFERPSARALSGEVRFTMRHECGMENMMGRGDSYTCSGGQWGAWNATFSPRGYDGKPVPLWNPKTGEIDHAVAEQWKRYDLRLYLEQNWKILGPKLRGKIHLWVGDADDYFLNNAVHLLDAFLSKADPPYEGSIRYGPGQGHTWCDLTDGQVMAQMAAAVEKANPKP